MTAEEILDDIGRTCSHLSEPIIDLVCKRAMFKINKDLKFGLLFTDDYPTSFSVIDVLSIRLQSEFYSEMGHGELLEDYIHDTIDLMVDELSPIEKNILKMRHLDYGCCDEYEYEFDRKDIYSRFHEKLNEHYELAKIQKFIEKRSW